jgi:hypothetical protein
MEIHEEQRRSVEAIPLDEWASNLEARAAPLSQVRFYLFVF